MEIVVVMVVADPGELSSTEKEGGREVLKWDRLC